MSSRKSKKIVFARDRVIEMSVGLSTTLGDVTVVSPSVDIKKWLVDVPLSPVIF